MEENSGIGAELTTLADLRERGVLSDGEFEKHKRQLLNGVPSWRKKRLSGVGIVGSLLAAIALTVALSATSSSKPASKSLSKVEIATVSATSSQLQQAVSYASKYVGQDHDPGYCLEFMQEAYRAAGISLSDEPTAAAYWAANPNGFSRVTASAYGTPPAGALMFWGSRPGYPAGHVALSVGNETAVSTSAYPYYDGIRDDPRVFIMTLSKRSPSSYNYVGYLMPPLVSTPTTPKPVAPSNPPTVAPLQPSSSGSSNPSPGTSTPQPTPGGLPVQPASGGSSIQPASGGSPSAGTSSGGGSVGGTSGGGASGGSGSSCRQVPARRLHLLPPHRHNPRNESGSPADLFGDGWRHFPHMDELRRRRRQRRTVDPVERHDPNRLQGDRLHSGRWE